MKFEVGDKVRYIKHSKEETDLELFNMGETYLITNVYFWRACDYDEYLVRLDNDCLV